jgi:hypothetical protein
MSENAKKTYFVDTNVLLEDHVGLMAECIQLQN